MAAVAQRSLDRGLVAAVAAARLAARAPSAVRIDELRDDRSHGGSWLARHAVETLVQEAAAPAADAEELLEHLLPLRATSPRPARARLGHRRDRAARRLRDRSWALSASELRRLVLDEARALLDRPRPRGPLDRRAARAAPRGQRRAHALLLGHVREAVLHTPPERLLCTVCDPDGEGRTFADELRGAGITVELVEDGAGPPKARAAAGSSCSAPTRSTATGRC